MSTSIIEIIANIITNVIGWSGVESSVSLVFNTIAAIITVVYVKIVIATTDKLVLKKIVRPATSRKIIHLAAASLVLFWPLFDQAHWSWRLNVLVPVIFTLRLFIKVSSIYTFAVALLPYDELFCFTMQLYSEMIQILSWVTKIFIFISFVSFRFVSFCFVSFRYVSVRFVSVRFGSVRFGSVWFGSVRFGSV